MTITIMELIIVVAIILAAAVIPTYQKYIKYFIILVILVIISIVAILSISAYQQYIKKSKVLEANMLFAEIKTKVMNFYSDKGIYPTFQELKDSGIVYKGTYVEGYYSDALATAGTPQVCFIVKGFDPGKNQIGWQYSDSAQNSDRKVWHCKKNKVTCTTIEDKYLPCSCKSKTYIEDENLSCSCDPVEEEITKPLIYTY